MKDFFKALINLLKVKTIVTLSLTFCFIWLCVNQIQIPESLKTLLDIVIGCYFGTQIEKSRKEITENGEE